MRELAHEYAPTNLHLICSTFAILKVALPATFIYAIIRSNMTHYMRDFSNFKLGVLLLIKHG